jgi:hypothetical protein
LIGVHRRPNFFLLRETQPMSTPAQIEANRDNALHSTGPRTPEGKARSSRNARRHGFTSTQLHLSDDDRPVFESIEADLRLEIDPQGTLEEGLFAQFLHSTWQLRRLRAEEEQVWQNEPNPLANPNKLNLITRYAARHERAVHRSLRQLRSLQTERALREITQSAAPCLPAPPPLADSRILTKQTQIQSRRPPATVPKVDTALAAIDRETDYLSSRTPSFPARNAPCPCGSGQKYKRCCGRQASPVLQTA